MKWAFYLHYLKNSISYVSLLLTGRKYYKTLHERHIRSPTTQKDNKSCSINKWQTHSVGF